MKCSLCHGTGTRWISGHAFNPALGRPWALVRCECIEAAVERAKLEYHLALGGEGKGTP